MAIYRSLWWWKMTIYRSLPPLKMAIYRSLGGKGIMVGVGENRYICGNIEIMKKFVTALVAMVFVWLGAAAALPQEVRWGNEAHDIAKIDSLVRALNAFCTTDPNKEVAMCAMGYGDTPYVAGTLEGEPEMLTITTEGFDCTTFVDLVAATASAVLDGGTSWTDVANRLREMRYRGGKVDGYASRHHYVSDWITENTYKGLIREVTDEAPTSRKKALTLNYMTKHRDKYPALADSATYEKMRDVESGLRGINTYYIPKAEVGSKENAAFMQDGDIAFITTSIPGLDVTHAGIIMKEPKTGEPHLFHASSRAGAVILDTTPLSSYLARQKTATGIRLVRLVRNPM